MLGTKPRLRYGIFIFSRPAYLHSFVIYHTPTRTLQSANTNLLSVPRVHTTFTSRDRRIAALQSRTHSLLAFAILSYTFCCLLKLDAFSMPSDPPSGSAKCLRFGHWLTLCTLNILFTYLFT